MTERHWPFDDDPVGALSHTVRLTDQTASVGVTALLTAPPPGLYYIDLYIECVLAGIAGTVAGNGIYFGSNGSVTQPSPTLALITVVPPNAHMSYRISCWVASGDVSFSTSMLGLVGTPRYNIIARASQALDS